VTAAGSMQSAPARWPRVMLTLLRLGMAAVFLTAAVPKIQAPDLFAASVLNYKILPPWGINTMAIVLPWLELILGVLLALGIWVRACTVWMGILIVTFMIAFVSATSRGLDISCGCFEVGEHAKPTSVWWVVLRDSAFLAAAAALFRFGGGFAPFEGKARAGLRLRWKA
jgi:uncharacterized membrane protein YphA (DoxX/SURF4 family)